MKKVLNIKKIFLAVVIAIFTTVCFSSCGTLEITDGYTDYYHYPSYGYYYYHPVPPPPTRHYYYRHHPPKPRHDYRPQPNHRKHYPVPRNNGNQRRGRH